MALNDNILCNNVSQNTPCWEIDELAFQIMSHELSLFLMKILTNQYLRSL